jgi:predicted nucleic acid-binding protein
MIAALDSNFMIYAESFADDQRCGVARSIIAAADIDAIIIPAQALAETLQWLVKKANRSRQEAASNAALWQKIYRIAPTSETVLVSALEVMTTHNLQVFDSIILAAAAEAGADLLLSEDMQHGFQWRGVTIVNPFLLDQHKTLMRLLNSPL